MSERLADFLRTEAIEEMELDAIYERHDNLHDERPDRESCFLCAEADAEAFAEHAWMGRAVRQNAVNPYAPDPTWTSDSAGYVRAPLVNRGTL